MKGLEFMHKDVISSMVGKIIASNTTESVELRILKQNIIALIDNLTQDENIIINFDELLSIAFVQAQTDSKFDGFIAGIEWADITNQN